MAEMAHSDSLGGLLRGLRGESMSTARGRHGTGSRERPATERAFDELAVTQRRVSSAIVAPIE